MILNITDRYILILDVETANDTTDAIVYDIGFILLDLYTGAICEQGSFVIRDTFVYERELVKIAYYADKIPEYIADIQQGKRQMMDFMAARRHILNIMAKYNCHTVAAYNASFDRNALNTTLRYLTKSQYRYFFPYSTNFVCIWNMACSTICQRGEYRTFAETNRLFSNHGKNYRATAETVYAFLTNNANFTEEHKGLDDVKIECEIFVKCFEEIGSVMGIKRNCWMNVKRGAIALR